jgi:hypothetical protein
VPKYKAYMTTETTYVACFEADNEEEALELAEDLDDWELHNESGGSLALELVK